ncbi:MAG TPA: Rrf2 family transcriptional regulator [Spirochaetaceae bacterium]|jgi:Rrf2 family protein|nr:Rrf2 family transcriptional regulator [Spirochaetaceae bacterium]
MKISTRSRYGLRLLIELCGRQGATVQVSELAAAQDIPLAYAAKLIDPLRVAGIVRSLRGSGGGISLARDARAISALEAVEALEGGLALVECNAADGSCEREAACPTGALWKGLEQAMRDYLAQHSLQELAAVGSGLDYSI